MAPPFRQTEDGFESQLAVNPLGHPPQQAALPTLYAALGNDVKGGEYLGPQGLLEMSGKPGRATRSPSSQDRVEAERLWTVSAELTGAAYFAKSISGCQN